MGEESNHSGVVEDKGTESFPSNSGPHKHAVAQSTKPPRTPGRTRFWNRHLPASSPPGSRLRRDILPRKGRKFDLDSQHIFEATQHHVKYTYNGTTLQGLEKYLDSTEYGISEESEKQLLKLEVERLVVVAQQDGPFLFDGKSACNSTDHATFDDLANVADQIKCSLDIIKLDIARTCLIHNSGDVQEATIDQFRLSRRRLLGRFNRDQNRVQGSEPKIVEPFERNQLLYFTLVDYITASIARLIVRTASSKYWNQRILACLASWAVKLKVLSYDQARFATLSIETAEHAVEEKTQSFGSKQAFFIKVQSTEDDKTKDVDALETETDTSGRYHSEQALFNHHTRHLIRFVLTDLRVSEDNPSSASCFEMSSMIYKAGLDGAPTALSSDRLGEISACSDAFRVKCSYTALTLVVTNLMAIKSATDARPSSSSDLQNRKTKIMWEWEDAVNDRILQKGLLWAADINHVLSIVIGLALSSTFVTNTLSSLIALASSGTADEDPVLQFESPPKNLKGIVTLSTADQLVKQSIMSGGKYRDDEIATLPNSPMRFGIRAGEIITRRNTDDITFGNIATQDIPATMANRFQREKSYMDTWVIAEDSVVIECRRYVRAIMVIAAIIVCGGVAIPFIVGGRIRGVDPFQLTTFAWLLAGFTAIVGKSRYVNEWPWHDFFHGRVVCRSVKDVCDVTRIDPQMILMYLLLEEQTTTLRTKGPYNGMFSRKTEDSSGFAIDEAVHISTMLASGFLVLKVLNETGEHLTCLDVRKGSEGQSPCIGETVEHLACMNLENYEDQSPLLGANQNGSPRPGKQVSQGKVRNINRVRKLSAVKFRVNRVLGVYVRDCRFG